jgi:hypothetical protein
MKEQAADNTTIFYIGSGWSTMATDSMQATASLLLYSAVKEHRTTNNTTRTQILGVIMLVELVSA